MLMMMMMMTMMMVIIPSMCTTGIASRGFQFFCQISSVRFRSTPHPPTHTRHSHLMALLNYVFPSTEEYPIKKAKSIRIQTHEVGNKLQPLFRNDNGVSQRYISPPFAQHWYVRSITSFSIFRFAQKYLPNVRICQN